MSVVMISARSVSPHSNLNILHCHHSLVEYNIELPMMSLVFCYLPCAVMVDIYIGWKVLSPSLKLVQTLEGHNGYVQCVTVSPTGSHFASGGYDEKVMIWKEPGEGGE